MEARDRNKKTPAAQRRLCLSSNLTAEGSNVKSPEARVGANSRKKSKVRKQEKMPVPRRGNSATNEGRQVKSQSAHVGSRSRKTVTVRKEKVPVSRKGNSTIKPKSLPIRRPRSPSRRPPLPRLPAWLVTKKIVGE